jgi:hypothetical protein
MTVSNCVLETARAGHAPKRLRAYRFAERKSQSPESAPSGVRQPMFVADMTCCRYARGSLY